jgi:AcrR family transcriptional regulator
MAEQREGAGGAVVLDQGLGVDRPHFFRKLKPGPGLPAEQVRADQRRRLHAAMLAMLAETDERGWGGVHVRPLAHAAGVSTSTFYRHFADVDDCLASTFEWAMSETLLGPLEAQRERLDWRQSLKAAVGTFLTALSRDPRVARLVLLDVFGAGPTSRKRNARTINGLEQLLTECMKIAPRVVAPRHLVAGMTAGMMRVARTTTLAGRGEELPGLADELSDWMLALVAPEVLSLPVPPDRPSKERGPREVHGSGDASPERHQSQGDDREKLIRAMVKLLSVDGATKPTVPELRAAAGVSCQGFDDSYESLDECFLDALEVIAHEAGDNAASWATTATSWEGQTCRFVTAICAQAALQQHRARLTFLGIFAAGRTGLLRRERLVSSTAANLRATIPIERRPTPIAAEASVAAAWHIAQGDVAAARHLPSVAPLLSYVLLTPAVGARAASDVVQAQTPPCE